jgi:hypothetical protein
MDRKKQLIFKYFDLTFRGYKKHGRRPVNMSLPHVLYEYKSDNGEIGFDYNTEGEIIRFDFDTFHQVKSMFGIPKSNLVNICKEYIADKFDNSNALSSTFFTRSLN